VLVGAAEVADAGVVASQVAALAALAEVEAVIRLVHDHIANLHQLQPAADIARVGRNAVYDLGQAAVQVRPPQLMALGPVELVADRVQGDLQGLCAIGGQAADQLLWIAAIQVGAPHAGWLGVVALQHLGPVELAVALVHGDVEDDLAWPFDQARPLAGVAQVGALDGVGQAANWLDAVVGGAHVGHRLGRHGRAAVADRIAGAGRHQAGLEAGRVALRDDAGELVAGLVAQPQVLGVGVEAQLVVGQRADEVVVLRGQIIVAHVGAVDGLRRAAAAAIAGRHVEGGEFGVHGAAELGPVAAAFDAVAQAVGGAHVNLVIAFDAGGDGEGPLAAAVGERRRAPLAIEGGHSRGGECAVVDDHIVQPTVEERRGRGRGVADECAVLGAESGGTGGAADRQLAVQVKRVAACAQTVNYLVPLAVGVGVGHGAAHFSGVRAADQDGGTHFAGVQEQVAVMLGDRGIRALGHAEQAAVGAGRAEPERGRQAALRQVQRLKGAQQVVHTVEARGCAVFAVFSAGGTAFVQAVDAHRIGALIVEKHSPRQVVERQVEQGAPRGQRRGGIHERVLHAGDGRIRVAHRAGDHRAVGQQAFVLVGEQFDGGRRHVNDKGNDLGRRVAVR